MKNIQIVCYGGSRPGQLLTFGAGRKVTAFRTQTVPTIALIFSPDLSSSVLHVVFRSNLTLFFKELTLFPLWVWFRTPVRKRKLKKKDNEMKQKEEEEHPFFHKIKETKKEEEKETFRI